MAHFLSCDLILLVSVKVIFDLENLSIILEISCLLSFIKISEFYKLDQ